jgi:hypothetical protein
LLVEGTNRVIATMRPKTFDNDLQHLQSKN